MGRKVISLGALVLVLACIYAPSSVAIAANKPGAKCLKLGASATYLGKKVICAKSGKVLKWKLAPVVKPKPSHPQVSPTPTTPPSTPTATPTPTPSTSASASATPSESPTPTPSPSKTKQSQMITALTTTALPITNTLDLSTIKSNAGLTVTTISKTPDICLVQGSTLMPVKTGGCTITSSQPGDDTYSAAEDLSTTLQISAPVITTPDVALDGVTTYFLRNLGGTFTGDLVDITLVKYDNDASKRVCASDISMDTCRDDGNNGSIPDPMATTRYVEFTLTVNNRSSSPIAEINFRLLVGDQLDFDSIVTPLPSINDSGITAGQSATGALMVEVPKGEDISGGFLLIDEGVTDANQRVLLALK